MKVYLFLALLILMTKGDCFAQNRSLDVLQMQYEQFLNADPKKNPRIKFKAHYQSKPDGSYFRYVTTDFSRIHLPADKFSTYYQKYKFLLDGYSAEGYGNIVGDGSEWTQEKNMHLFNCHAYTFRNVISITPKDWLEGSSAAGFSNPVRSILDNLCKPIVVDFEPTPENIQLIDLGYDINSQEDRELVYLLGFEARKADGSKETVYSHSGTAMKKHDTLFVRSKMGDNIMEMYLPNVNAFFSQSNNDHGLPSDLKMSLYACKSTGWGDD